MRIFGCIVYFKNTNIKGDKFEEKGKPGVFLGYPTGTKGYKVYGIQGKRITASRDVIFCEDIFPFKKTKVDDNFKDEGPIKFQNGMCHDRHTPTQIVEIKYGKNLQAHNNEDILTNDLLQNKLDPT